MKYAMKANNGDDGGESSTSLRSDVRSSVCPKFVCKQKDSKAEEQATQEEEIRQIGDDMDISNMSTIESTNVTADKRSLRRCLAFSDLRVANSAAVEPPIGELVDGKVNKDNSAAVTLPSAKSDVGDTTVAVELKTEEETDTETADIDEELSSVDITSQFASTSTITNDINAAFDIPGLRFTRETTNPWDEFTMRPGSQKSSYKSEPLEDDDDYYFYDAPVNSQDLFQYEPESSNDNLTQSFLSSSSSSSSSSESDVEFEGVPLEDLLYIEGETQVQDAETVDATPGDFMAASTQKRPPTTSRKSRSRSRSRSHSPFRDSSRNIPRTRPSGGAISRTLIPRFRSPFLETMFGAADMERARRADQEHEELIMLGFQREEAIISEAEIELFSHNPYSRYRVRFPSGLRSCWIVEGSSEDLVGVGEDAGAWDSYDDDEDLEVGDGWDNSDF